MQDASVAGADVDDVAGLISRAWADPGARDAPSRGEDAGTLSADVESDPAATGAAAERPLSGRDVWRAARARRKTLRAEIRRFTLRSRRRRTAWIVGVAAGLLVVGGSAAAAYSPLFAVEEITVVGASTLDPAAVEDALAGQRGVPLALVSSSDVKAALVRFPMIETYGLEAKPPHELVVRIVERAPVGVILEGDDYTVVDGAGVALSTTPTRPEGHALIQVEGGTASPAFTAAGTVMRSLAPELRAQVDAVTANSIDDVTLALTSGVRVVWGSSERSGDKALRLQEIMAAVPGQSVYDVSSPDAISVG